MGPCVWICACGSVCVWERERERGSVCPKHPPSLAYYWWAAFFFAGFGQFSISSFVSFVFPWGDISRWSPKTKFPISLILFLSLSPTRELTYTREHTNTYIRTHMNTTLYFSFTHTRAFTWTEHTHALSHTHEHTLFELLWVFWRCWFQFNEPRQSPSLPLIQLQRCKTLTWIDWTRNIYPHNTGHRTFVLKHWYLINIIRSSIIRVCWDQYL